MSVKQRLKNIIKDNGMTISSFEKEINASNGYVNSISKGIGKDKLENILELFPNLNIAWLLTGSGEQYYNDDSYIVLDDGNLEVRKIVNIIIDNKEKFEQDEEYRSRILDNYHLRRLTEFIDKNNLKIENLKL